jgi:hypothetical protein
MNEWNDMGRSRTSLSPGEAGTELPLHTKTANREKLRLTERSCQTSVSRFIHCLKKAVGPINLTILMVSAYAWQLLAEHHIQHPGSANLRPHQNHPGMLRNDLSDDGGVLAEFMLLHLLKYRLGHLGRNNG